MKKITGLFLASVFALAGLTSCTPVGGGSDNTDEKLAATLWGAESTVSYMQDDVMPEGAKAALSMEAIKGETESVQLMMTATEKATSFNVTVGDLKANGGGKIAKSNVEIFAERYIETTKPSVENPRTANMYIGFYPDALIPMDRFIRKKENKIEKGMNQGIWFNVHIPSDAESGVYEGKVTVTVNEQTAEVPLTLKVYDLEMPQEVHNTNSFGLWYHYIQYGEGDKITDETYSNYYWWLANKRITPTYIPFD